jgi:hypothetical protein
MRILCPIFVDIEGWAAITLTRPPQQRADSRSFVSILVKQAEAGVRFLANF